MEPNAPLRRAVRAFYLYLAALIVAATAPFAATALTDAGAMGARIAGVLVGVGGWIPIIVATARVIRRSDEFVRRLNLVACSLAFAGALLIVSLADWLVRARFLRFARLDVLWLGIALLWGCCLFGARWYYGDHHEEPAA
jgi:hypothetical protein